VRHERKRSLSAFVLGLATAARIGVTHAHVDLRVIDERFATSGALLRTRGGFPAVLALHALRGRNALLGDFVDARAIAKFGVEK
tara:strand:+ start:246 stop:497 length:252 start_codon:yes stop_codon:yes gene_type:complete